MGCFSVIVAFSGYLHIFIIFNKNESVVFVYLMCIFASKGSFYTEFIYSLYSKFLFSLLSIGFETCHATDEWMKKLTGQTHKVTLICSTFNVLLFWNYPI